MSTSPLSPSSATRTAERVIHELGDSDRKHLQSILALVPDDGRLRLDRVLDVLPKAPRAARLTALRQFRERLRAASKQQSVEFELTEPTPKKGDPADRHCWFQGEDGAVEAATRYAEKAAIGPARSPQSAAPALRDPDGRLVATIFVCYAHADEPGVGRLIDDIEDALNTSTAAKQIRFRVWRDTKLDPGHPWKDGILSAIARSQLGLLFASPRFFRSEFIRDVELPQFVSAEPFRTTPGKLCVPVAFGTLTFNGTIDMRELDRRQIYFGKGGKAYEELKGRPARDAFVAELVGHIVNQIRADLAPRLPASTSSRVPVDPEHDLDRQARDAAEAGMPKHFERTRAFESSMDKLEATARKERPIDGKDAVESLLAWARNPEAPRYFALLGETGMGKTTTCKAFASQLLRAREKSAKEPIALYFDLRTVGKGAQNDPDLAGILDLALRGSWLARNHPDPVTVTDILKVVREQECVVIFDGLDEVLVHLSDEEGRRFTRKLWSILPDPSPIDGRARGGADATKKDRPKGRLLLTCRSHYFRTIRHECTHFTGEGREGFRPNDYAPPLVLLPFTEDQIRAYLKGTLPNDDPERILGVIREVHNLREIAERPYTLSLIAQHLPKIERWKAEGRTVTGALLYGEIVQDWLDRDEGKHRIDRSHKPLFMEHVASELHQAGERSWNADQLESWIAGFFASRDEIRVHYGYATGEAIPKAHLDLYKEDLRTATFLVRAGDDRFRFAHSSLQEFFLARYLKRALIEGRIEAWELETPSVETLDFLGQLLLDAAVAERDRALLALRRLRDGNGPKSRLLLLDYALRAFVRGYPAPVLAGIRLDGADLRDREFTSGSLERLNLVGASLRGARLDRSTLRNVDLSEVDLEGASLTQTRVIGGSLSRAKLGAARLDGAFVRGVDASEATLDVESAHHAAFIGVRLSDPRDLVSRGALVIGGAATPSDGDSASARLDDRLGHAGWVSSSGFSPDGRRLVSSSDDGTVRVWDATSGECVLVLRGDEGGATSSGFSPDGRRLVSSGYDGTVRVWDATSGESELVLKGHEGWATSSGLSPDGRRLVSSGSDGTVRAWDATSGESVLVLKGHEGAVYSSGFSPDGRRLVSSGSDGTVRVWDATSGESVLVLKGHEGQATSSGFSPDGRRLVSSGSDGTVRVWDATSGESVLVLKGHEGQATSSGFSPDGRRLVSSGSDGTVRVWDATSGESVLVLKGHEGWVASSGFSPDGRRLVSSGDDRTVRVWEATSGDSVLVLMGGEGGATSIGLSPDGRRLVSSGDDGTVRVWDATSGESVLVLKGHDGWVASSGFTSDGRRLVSSGDDGTVRVWDATSGESLLVLKGHEGGVTSSGFSPDGRRLVSSGDDGTVRVWGAMSGESLLVLKGHEGGATSSGFSPDGRRLVSSGSDGTVRVWDATSGESVRVLKGHEGWATSSGFSPDGRRLVSSGSDGTVRVWDSTSGESVRVLKGHQGWATSSGFSPDGRRLVSSGSDGTVRVWDATSGESVLVLKGHEGQATSSGFSPDGRRLVSSGSDRTVRVWDATSGEEIGPRISFLPESASLSLDPRTNRILATSGEAWLYAAWLGHDPVTGEPRRYPLEYFGPVPGASPRVA